MRAIFTVALSGMVALGMTGISMAQGQAPQSQGPDQSLLAIHGPQSIAQELDHLTKDLELAPSQLKTGQSAA